MLQQQRLDKEHICIAHQGVAAAAVCDHAGICLAVMTCTRGARHQSKMSSTDTPGYMSNTKLKHAIRASHLVTSSPSCRCTEFRSAIRLSARSVAASSSDFSSLTCSISDSQAQSSCPNQSMSRATSCCLHQSPHHDACGNVLLGRTSLCICHELLAKALAVLAHLCEQSCLLMQECRA